MRHMANPPGTDWLFRPYCWTCRKAAGPLRCAKCGAKSGRWYICQWPPLPPLFRMKGSVTAPGEREPYFTSEVKPSVQRDDGTISTDYQEIDKRDPDKSKRRRVHKVMAANGRVKKHYDGPLGGEGHGGAIGVEIHPASPPPPDDPMTIRVAVKQPFT